MKNFRLKIYLVICMALGLTASCKQFITVEAPIDKIVLESVFTSDEVATSAVRGMYVTMASGGFASGGGSSVTMLSGRSSDEFTNFYTLNDTRTQFATNNLLSTNNSLQSGLWTNPYQLIYSANAIIENLKEAPISNAVKQQLTGEAKFVRALCYFYLTNLFGDVPLVLSTDYRENATEPAALQADVYAQVIKDLEEAKAILSDAYPGADRTRANRWAAIALLARVYLYTKNYAKAEEYSSEVIGNTSRYKLITDDLNKVFLKNSEEAIFQLFVPVINNVNTYDGFAMILTAAPSSSTEAVLNNQLYNAFEPGDLRQSKWIGTFTSGTNKWYYPLKYKVKTGASPSTEYSMVLRIGEQYLIRAEARINQNMIASGVGDLNTLRARARAAATVTVPNPLPSLSTGMSQANALSAVENERRIELFSEWGHRWLDLKRTGRADAVIGALKGVNWQATDKLYPIPNSELLNNPSLKQNPGYN